MRRLWLGLAGLFVVLASVVLARALSLAAAPIGGVPAATSVSVDSAAAAARLSQAIQFRTISHQDPLQEDTAAFDGLRAFFAVTYPRAHEALRQEMVSRHGVLYTWPGSDPALPPILLMGHVDVVPVEPGTEPQWSYPPFDGAVAEGFVWGRGTLDNKSSIIAIFEAIESLVQNGFKPRRTVYLALGPDEELGGAQGAQRSAAWFKRHNIRLLWVLDEGVNITQGVLPGVRRPVAGIAVCEKGYLSLELTATAEGGHASMPPHQTAIGVLSAAIARLEQRPFPTRLIEPTRRTLVGLAPEMSFGRRLVLANLWLFGSAVERELAAERATNAWVRTTMAPTIVEGGIKENVLPASARAIVNFRILPGDSIAGVIAHVRAAIGEDPISVQTLTQLISEPSPVARTEAPGFEALAAATRRVFPEAIVIPAMVTGATDSRHLTSVADDVYRFSPRVLTPADLRRIHGTNERIGVEALGRAIEAYRAILEAGAS